MAHQGRQGSRRKPDLISSALSVQQYLFNPGSDYLVLQLFLVYVLAASYARSGETHRIFSVAPTNMGIQRNISIPVATSTTRL